MFAGASTTGLGHSHDRITKVITEQANKLIHVSAIYMNDQHNLYAEELAARLPEGLDTIFFASSGSEANAMVA